MHVTEHKMLAGSTLAKLTTGWYKHISIVVKWKLGAQHAYLVVGVEASITRVPHLYPQYTLGIANLA